MEEKRLERLAREFTGAMAARDADRAVALAHPDIVYQSLPLDGRRIYRGHDGLRKRIAKVKPFDYRATDLEVRVLDEQRFVGLGNMRIDDVEQSIVCVARVQDGLVIEARVYFSDETLLAELGVFKSHQPARTSPPPAGS